MSNVWLLPRLSDLGVTQCLEDLEVRSKSAVNLTAAAARRAKYEAWIWYAPSGGSVANELPDEIRRNMLALAERHGYPDRASEKQKANFDTDAAKWLAIHLDASLPELLRDDVWAFVTCILLQDLVIWRYPNPNRARLAGGVRNTFQRLWVRGKTLDLGAEAGSERWRLLQAPSEDAMVQIFERASIASDANLARAIAQGWVTTANNIGREKMEDVMRRATKLLRLRNQIVDLSFMSAEELEAEVQQAFNRSAVGLSLNGRDNGGMSPLMARIGRVLRAPRLGGGAKPT